uniref:Uncharacterized protein n=1 Tax=Coniferiporia sulphurascens TaxID=175648 RepID=A0A5B9RDB6_CONSH|nr:hypothetical protein PSUO_000059 [Coniferiporia sulphurascens]QEG57160.1 hypothetical protein PSUO_000059 [Coniferiporia sulphurascens]
MFWFIILTPLYYNKIPNMKNILKLIFSLLELSMYLFLIASCFITMYALLLVPLYYNVLTIDMSIIHLISFIAVCFGLTMQYLLAVIEDFYLLIRCIIPIRHRELFDIIRNKFRKY